MTRLLLAALSIVYLGDSLTSAAPGYVGDTGERVIVYHLADAILFLNDMPAPATGQAPDVVVLELGIHAVHGSDRVYGCNYELFRRRYGQLLDAAHAAAAPRVVAINIPWLDWPANQAARARAFNAIIEEEAAWRMIPVVDAWSLLQDCGPACIGPDGFHPNQQGYDLLATAVGESLAAGALPALPTMPGCPVPR